MNIETQVVKVINKMRKIFCFGKYKYIMSVTPSICVVLRDGKLVLSSLSFDAWDRLILFPTRIVFRPEHGHEETLMRFDSIQDFLDKEDLLMSSNNLMFTAVRIYYAENHITPMADLVAADGSCETIRWDSVDDRERANTRINAYTLFYDERYKRAFNEW